MELTEQIQQQALNSPHIQGRFFIFYENQNVLYILILKPENDLGMWGVLRVGYRISSVSSTGAPE